jgi:hypothetical protein
MMKRKKILKLERYNDRYGCRSKIDLLLRSFHTSPEEQRIRIKVKKLEIEKKLCNW